jgi:phage tail-like protein
MARSGNILDGYPSFRFVVKLDGNPVGVFMECSLPNIEWDVEEIKEGGLNTYIHQLPGRRKSAKITLKNGVGRSKDLIQWYTQSMSEKFKRRKLTVSLLDSTNKPVMTLDIKDAYPIKWTGPNLKSDDNTIAIQTLEFGCGEITLK